MTVPSVAAIRAEALRLGFVACGAASLDPSTRGAALDAWLRAGHAGTMGYLPRQARKRKHPATITPGARSAIVVLENYTPPPNERPQPGDAFKIASYARGTDYHLVLHGRLHRLAEWLLAAGAGLAHVWVDDGPVPERELAERAGLGWIGKNTMLIHPQIGSYTLIGTIFTDLELHPDLPTVTDHCGTCTRCLEVCPTEAFVTERVLDATRCLSYLTIEHRGEPPAELYPAWDGWAFGCDACNDACPWNVKFAEATAEPEYRMRPHPDRRDPAYFERLTEAEFTQHFAETPLARPGLDRMRRNTRLAVASRHREP